MELKEGMKYFEAVTYDKQTYHFALSPEGEIKCIEFGKNIFPAYQIEIKPNFVLRDTGLRTIYSLADYHRDIDKKKTNESLISEWIIPDDLFEYLVNSKKMINSTFTAELYGFDPQYAHDARHQTRFCKKTRNNPEAKARILEPIKAGKFH